uniref:Uncharacterized protein n=1 Tax=Strigamia maritima TaxID=126957 RepID=T1J3X5_STRMM
NLELEPTARAFRDWFLDPARNQSFCPGLPSLEKNRTPYFKLFFAVAAFCLVAIDTSCSVRISMQKAAEKAALLIRQTTFNIQHSTFNIQHSTWKNCEEDTMLSISYAALEPETRCRRDTWRNNDWRMAALSVESSRSSQCKLQLVCVVRFLDFPSLRRF